MCYNVYRFEADASDADPVKFTSSSNSFIDTTSGDNPVIGGKKYIYLVTAVYNNDETAFADNPASASVSNQFEMEEAGNLGYVYRDIGVEDFSVTESFETENTLAPYFKITFKMDETNSVYKITAQNDTAGIIVKLSDLTDRHGNIWTNGLTEDQSGYISLDTESLMAVVNADIGVIDESYAISSFSIQAWQSEDSDANTTKVQTVDESHYKDLGVYDYLFLVNTALSLEIKKADDQFHSDWWCTTGWFDPDPQVYHGDKITITNSSEASQKQGSIKLDEYQYNGIILSSNYISTWAQDDGGVLNSGYRGTDVLYSIGNDSTNCSVKIDVIKTIDISGKNIGFKDAEIKFINICVDKNKNSGSYDVEIVDSVSVTGILKTDPKVIKNIAIG